jgi:hypothetical protein
LRDFLSARVHSKFPPRIFPAPELPYRKSSPVKSCNPLFVRTPAGAIDILGPAITGATAGLSKQWRRVMNMKKLITASALVIGLGLSSAAMAQSQNQDNNANNNGGGADSTTTVWNDLIDFYYQDNAADTLSVTSTASSEENGNTAIIAEQYLYAENSNSELDEVVDLDGEDETDTAVGYNSGNNSVNDNAFAAYAGILNQAWNTGINANTQAATNIAAQGTVNFGVNSGEGSGGDD